MASYGQLFSPELKESVRNNGVPSGPGPSLYHSYQTLRQNFCDLSVSVGVSGDLGSAFTPVNERYSCNISEGIRPNPSYVLDPNVKVKQEMLPLAELKKSLIDVTKECESLYQHNKDIQGHFINELTELQGFQGVLNQLQEPMCNGANVDKGKLDHTKMKIQQIQSNAAKFYQDLNQKRQDLVDKLKDGVQQIALMQNDLISVQLLDWKRRQKRAQIGEPFDHREDQLNSIQRQFELLAEHNWQLRTYASWLLDLLRRGPQLPADTTTHLVQTGLTPIVEHLTKLLWVLVSQSFIVSQQPDPVIKTNHKFTAEVRLLIGDKLGIKQQLDNANVTVKIIGEDQARQLHANQLKEQSIKSGMGTISNDFEKLQLNDHGHMSAKFSNTKLTKIAPRKAAQKGSEKPGATATDQKYALLFSISSFQLGTVGLFDIWTLSLPIMVTVHGSQDCDAQSNILWQRAFGDVHWEPTNTANEAAVTWPQLAEVLRYKFQVYTGTQRPLSDGGLQYLGEKLCSKERLLDFSHPPPKITFQMFAKQCLLGESGAFPFWEWFFNVMQLIRQKLLVFWDEGWVCDFVSKQEASQMLVTSPHPTFLLRFSDSQLGAISIGFACQDQGNVTPFHMQPFTVRELEQLSLAARIAKCPQLADIKYMYPKTEKEDVLRKFEGEDRNKSPSPSMEEGGYIGCNIVMVAKQPITGRSGSVGSPGLLQHQQMSPGGTTAGTSAAMDQSGLNPYAEDFTALLNLMASQEGQAVFPGLLGEGFPGAMGGEESHMDPGLLNDLYQPGPGTGETHAMDTEHGPAVSKPDIP